MRSNRQIDRKHATHSRYLEFCSLGERRGARGDAPSEHRPRLHRALAGTGSPAATSGCPRWPARPCPAGRCASRSAGASTLLRPTAPAGRTAADWTLHSTLRWTCPGGRTRGSVGRPGRAHLSGWCCAARRRWRSATTLHELALPRRRPPTRSTCSGTLGPDLLGTDWDPDAGGPPARRRTGGDPSVRRSLDQRSWPGWSNLYKCELLFLGLSLDAGRRGARPAGTGDPGQRLLAANRGRWTENTTGSLAGARTAATCMAGGPEPCRRCGTAIGKEELGVRAPLVPTCQPPPAPTPPREAGDRARPAPDHLPPGRTTPTDGPMGNSYSGRRRRMLRWSAHRSSPPDTTAHHAGGGGGIPCPGRTWPCSGDRDHTGRPGLSPHHRPVVPAAQNGTADPAPASLDPAAVPATSARADFADSPRPVRDPQGRVVTGTGLRNRSYAPPVPWPAGRTELGGDLPVATPDRSAGRAATLRHRVSEYTPATAPGPALDHPAARLPPAQPGHRSGRAQHRRPAGAAIPPRAADHRRGRGRPVRIKFITSSHRPGRRPCSCRWTPASRGPAGSAGGTGALPAEPGRAAAVRRAHRLDQRRQPVAVGDPGRGIPVPDRAGPDPRAGHAAARGGGHAPSIPERASGRLMCPPGQHPRAVPVRPPGLRPVSSPVLLDRPVEDELVADGVPPRRPAPPGDPGPTFRPRRRPTRRRGPHLGPGALGTRGHLWHPHVLQPRAGPVRDCGRNPTGRWD